MLQYILQFCRAPDHKLFKSLQSAENDAISNNAKIHKKLLMYFRVTEEMCTKLRKDIGLQQTKQQTATAENNSIFGKNMCVSARWFASCNDHHILHTGT